MTDNNRFIAAGTATVRMLTDYLNEIDNRLARYAFFLHKLQPFHNGRITLEWLKRRDTVVPAPVVWFYVRGTGPWMHDPLPLANLTRRNKRGGAFHDNAKKVSAILGRVKELLELRASTVKRFNDFRDAIQQTVEYRKPLLAELHEELDHLDREHATPVEFPMDSANWGAAEQESSAT